MNFSSLLLPLIIVLFLVAVAAALNDDLAVIPAKISWTGCVVLP